jgi:glycosyltransferase involved in cell wall biosynthesis
MPRTLLLASDFGPTGPARLAARLAAALPDRDVIAVDLTARGGRLPGVPCFAAPLTNAADPRGLRSLVRILRDFRPDVVHAFGDRAFTAAAVLKHLGVGPSFRLVVSGADRSRHGLDAWQFRRLAPAVDVFTAPTAAEAARYTALGVPADHIHVIPPGVALAASADATALRETLGVPATARLVVCPADFTRFEGVKSAVWAFDVLKYVVPDLHLVLVGDGPERERAERFAVALGFDDYRVHFVGAVGDVFSLLALAEVVWLTRDRGGVTVSLEAMAARKPVVAFASLDLDGVVTDGVTGRLVPPHDRVKLAGVTAELLDDPSTASRLGDAGRARAAGDFPLSAMASRYAAVYDGGRLDPPPAP